jgi:hypothetical protein
VSRTHRQGHQRHLRAPHGLPFAITEHAVETLRARVMPQLTYGRVQVEARILARSAQKTERATGCGDEIWIATDGQPIRFVVKNEGGKRVCVTVLAPAPIGADDLGEEDVA